MSLAQKSTLSHDPFCSPLFFLMLELFSIMFLLQGKPSGGPRVTFGREELFDSNPEVIDMLK